MNTMSTQATWGIDGPTFLALYAALCVAAVVAIWRWRAAADGPAPTGAEPELGVHELAMLGGGPQLAITSAATQLMRDGVLGRGPSDGTLDVAGELAPDADPLERAVFEAVAREPGLSVTAMRADVLRSDALAAMQAELVEARLLLSPAAARWFGWRWIVGAALCALGGARLWAGSEHEEPIGFLLVIVIVVLSLTRSMFRERPVATRHGEAILYRWRTDCGDPERHAVSGDRTLTAALFGGGALWLAEPAIASALELPVEPAGGGSSGGGGGGWGGCGGCGGCGGG